MLSIGKREWLIPVWRGEGVERWVGVGVGGREGRGGKSDLGAIGQTEIEAKVGEDLSSFICADFTQNIIFAI